MQGNQHAGFAVCHDFGYPTHIRRDNGGPTGHGFQVNEAEGFVDGRADEDGCGRVQADDVFFGEKPGYPDDLVLSLRPCRGNPFFRFFHDLFRIRQTGTEYDLDIRVQVLYGVDEMQDSLLTGNPTHKKDIGLFRVDSVEFEHAVVSHGCILGRVDAVVNDPHPSRLNPIHALHVFLHGTRYRDDSVGIFIGCLLQP